MPAPADTTTTSAASTQALIAGLLRAYMGLEHDQVVVYNQKWKIPPDERLYVTVSSIGPNRQYGATVGTRLDLENKELVEDVAVASREMIGVDVYSVTQEAVDRKEEVTMALASTACQQLCEQYSIKVARIPLTFVDASSLEGTARLNRFHLSFAVLRTRTKSTPIESFDEFQQPKLAIEP